MILFKKKETFLWLKGFILLLRFWQQQYLTLDNRFSAIFGHRTIVGILRFQMSPVVDYLIENIAITPISCLNIKITCSYSFQFSFFFYLFSFAFLHI